MKRNILSSLLFLFFMSILTGVLYPLSVTWIAANLFPEEAKGSLIYKTDHQGQTYPIGSSLIGQEFSSPKYFWGRPSLTGYRADTFSGTNWGPTHEKLKENVFLQLQKFFPAANAITNEAPIKALLKSFPSELLFSSGSGLDPHISPAAAFFQVERIMTARNLPNKARDALRSLIHQETEEPTFGFLGQSRVNVLQLNLALDSLIAF